MSCEYVYLTFQGKVTNLEDLLLLAMATAKRVVLPYNSGCLESL